MLLEVFEDPVFFTLSHNLLIMFEGDLDLVDDILDFVGG